ncbi:K02A2.6-like [Cordylochernes scorpioides]|uniref:K02A2.6-like n=1 Tax=Cordylochernes scorpioides TaxID=51811 RepID=A0ABY6LP59_9ARAC|nr:K02A2.6-like [Cordylochernes scorpioides]
MLENGIIEQSFSPFSSPVTLVTKRDKTKRFCIDYRKVNELICSDVHPLPRIEDILDRLAQAKYFSTADISSAYWQVPIHPDSRPLLAFATLEGLYQPTRLPFGLKTSPQICERAMSQVLQRHGLDCVAHYFDDFIIFSNTLEEHQNHLRRFFAFCEVEKLQLNFAKCEFFKQSIDFLGYTITAGTNTPLTRNTDIIHAIKQPYNRKTLQSFLGVVDVYNKFIPEYARLRTPLNNLLKKDVVWVWDEACQRAFISLKESLTQHPILHLYKEGLPCQVYCDASTLGIAGILKQVIKRVLQDGSPKRLLTDRAPAFTSPKFDSFLLNRNIHPLLTTSNNPQANGLCERLNATLTGNLRLLHLENPKIAWTNSFASILLRHEERLCRRIVYREIIILEESLCFDMAVESCTESREMQITGLTASRWHNMETGVCESSALQLCTAPQYRYTNPTNPDLPLTPRICPYKAPNSSCLWLIYMSKKLVNSSDRSLAKSKMEKEGFLLFYMVDEVDLAAANKGLRLRNKQKFYYDKGSRDEPTFKIGQEVYLRENRRNWKPATIVREDGPKSYTVQNNKGLYRRNQSHITTNQSQRDHESILEQEPSGSACSTMEQDQETQPKGSDSMELQSETDNPAGEEETREVRKFTRSGRQVKPPKRMDL